MAEARHCSGRQRATHIVSICNDVALPVPAAPDTLLERAAVDNLQFHQSRLKSEREERHCQRVALAHARAADGCRCAVAEPQLRGRAVEQAKERLQSGTVLAYASEDVAAAEAVEGIPNVQ